MERERGAFGSDGGVACVCGALWTGMAGLGGAAVFVAAGLAAAAVVVVAVRVVGRVRFTRRGEELEKYLEARRTGWTLREKVSTRRGDDDRTAPMKGRSGKEVAMLLIGN